MKTYDIIIVGGGPMGIATAIEAKKKNLSTLILEKGTLVNSIYHFPKNMMFFSTSQKLEIGDVPFLSIHEKPRRGEALEYYRRVVEKWNLNIQFYEPVEHLEKQADCFSVFTNKGKYQAKKVVVATGFYAQPNLLNVKGEDLPKVCHYFREAHQYIGQKVVVIGAGNSACQVALELYHKGIDVTMVIRKNEIKPSVKYWIKPNIENRISEGAIKAFFNATVLAIGENNILIQQGKSRIQLENDFVLAMTGYQPDYDLLQKFGILNCSDNYQTPIHSNDSQETNVKGLYLAGVVCGGLKTNRYIIENSMMHATKIINHITKNYKINSITKDFLP